MSKTIQYEHYPKLRKRKVTKTYEQGYGQNGGVSSLGTTYEDTDSDGVLDTVVKNSTRIGAFKRTVSVVGRSYLPQPASTCTATSPCVPVIASLAPTNITNHGATLNASLTSTGGIDPDVTIYMGTTDRGEIPFGWSEGSTPLGNIGVGPITQAVSGLSLSTTYYYRVKAVNSAGTTWSSSQSFLTTAPSYTTAVGYADLATLFAATPTVGTLAYVTGTSNVFYIGDGTNWLIYNP